MIMNVAVPCEKHSPRFGQDASSHTLCSPCSRSSRFTRATAGPDGARTRIQGGFRGRGPSVGITFTGMREVLSFPRISRVGRGPGVVVAMVFMCAVYGTFHVLRESEGSAVPAGRRRDRRHSPVPLNRDRLRAVLSSAPCRPGRTLARKTVRASFEP